RGPVCAARPPSPRRLASPLPRLPHSLFFSILRAPPRPTLFPYTTLFRSRRVRRDVVGELLDLQLQARLLREVVLDEGQDLGVRYGARGDDQGAVAVGGGVVLVGAAGGEAEGEGSGGEDSGGDLGGVTHEKCLSLVVRPLGARGAARSAVVLGGVGWPGSGDLADVGGGGFAGLQQAQPGSGSGAGSPAVHGAGRVVAGELDQGDDDGEQGHG